MEEQLKRWKDMQFLNLYHCVRKQIYQEQNWVGRLLSIGIGFLLGALLQDIKFAL